ncbi:MAG: hypothetical protein P4N59_15985 [Negativicutes bacterium]|nr:hypothetical protein [Negativicutes bacterium]
MGKIFPNIGNKVQETDLQVRLRTYKEAKTLQNKGKLFNNIEQSHDYKEKHDEKLKARNDKTQNINDINTSSYETALEVLGIKHGISKEKAERAWKEHIKRNHPDLGGSTRVSQLINTSWDTIKKFNGWN